MPRRKTRGPGRNALGKSKRTSKKRVSYPAYTLDPEMIVKNVDYHRRRVERNNPDGEAYREAIEGTAMYCFLGEHILLNAEARIVLEQLGAPVIDESPYYSLLAFIKDRYSIDTGD